MIRQHLSWRIASIKSSPRWIFVNPSGRFLSASLAFSFSNLSWCVHITSLDFGGTMMRGFVLTVPVPISFYSCLLIKRFGDKAFMKLVYDQSFDLKVAILASDCRQKIHWSEPCCVGRFPNWLAKSAVDRVKTFTALNKRRGTNGVLLDTYPEAAAIWLSVRNHPSRNAESAVVRYHSEVPSRQAIYLGAPATFPVYYVDVDSEASRELSDVNATDKSFEHTVSRSECTEF